MHLSRATYKGVPQIIYSSTPAPSQTLCMTLQNTCYQKYKAPYLRHSVLSESVLSELNPCIALLCGADQWLDCGTTQRRCLLPANLIEAILRPLQFVSCVVSCAVNLCAGLGKVTLTEEAQPSRSAATNLMGVLHSMYP